MKKVEELQEAQRKANGVPEYPVVEKKPEITFDDFEKSRSRSEKCLSASL